MFFQIALQLSLLLLTTAHFQLQFPSPRGPFNEDQEPNFCDGYTTPASNRTQLSLTDSYISLVSEHPSWVVTVLLANTPNPTSFDNFTQVTAFTKNTGEGTFCMPFSLTQSNATALGLQDGQNVTLQVLFAADDGKLFQCADVTLSNSSTNAQPSSGCQPAQLQASSNGSSGSGTSGKNGVAEKLTGRTSIPSAIAMILITFGLLHAF